MINHSFFSPHGYNLPLEYTKLAAECSRGRPHSGKEDTKHFEDKPIWICKPVAQSQGRGIFLFRVNIYFTFFFNDAYISSYIF